MEVFTNAGQAPVGAGVGNGSQAGGFRTDDQTALIVWQAMGGQRPALVIDCRIEPVELAVQAHRRNDMIESQRRRLPLIEGAAFGGVDQHRPGFDAQRPQGGDKQKRLVFAVAESPVANRGGVRGFVGLYAHFNSEITHFILDKAQDGQDPFLRAGNAPPRIELL